MKKIIKIGSPLAILISLVLIILLRTIPAGKLWDKYVVLYVPVETEDSVVLDVMEKTGIKDVVSLSGQFLPLNISEDSIEYAMFKTTADSEENQYISDRNSYFFDKSNKYRLYYVSKDYENHIGKCISTLKKYNIDCGIDSNAKYPVFFPIIVTLFAAVVCFFSKNRSLFAVTAVIPVLYVFCNPFFPIALSICLLLLCGYFVANLWRRQGAISYLNSFLFIPICLVAALLCGFASSIMSGLLFVVAAIGMFSVFITYYWIENAIRERKSFIPVYIRSAKMVSMKKSELKVIFAICSFTSLLLLGVFTLTSSDTFESKSASVMLPSSSSMPSSELPQLEDYYKWAWNVTTYPYKSLNDKNEDSDNKTVIFPEYTSENGVITMTEKVLNFDSSFEKSVFNNIENLQFNSIEEVMQSEGAAFKGGYNTTSSYHLDLFGIIMIIMCYFILLFIYFSIIMKARKGAKK